MEKPIFKNFNELTPVIIQEYERYLPTAFDNSMTLLEKLNKIIEFMNETGRVTNDLVKQWNDLMLWIDSDGLEMTLEDILDKWDASGKLSSIINQKVFAELYESLDTKIKALDTKTTTRDSNIESNYRKKVDQINMSDLAQDVKTAMTGGSVSVVGVNAVSAINLNTNAVNEYEAGFVSKNKNLFVSDTFTYGKILVSGALIDSPTVGISDFIRIAPSSTLYKNKDGAVMWFDSSKTLISSLPMATTAQALTVPSNAYYVRVHIYHVDVPTYQLELNTVGTTYEKGEFKLKKHIKIEKEGIVSLEGSKLLNGTTPIDKLEKIQKSRNVLNKRNVQTGFIDRSNGVITYEVGNRTFHQIFIAGTKMRVSPISTGACNIVFYDVNKTFIFGSGLQLLPTATNWVVDVPANAVYFSISCSVVDVNSIMVSWGETIYSYEPYYAYPADLVFPDETQSVVTLGRTLTLNKNATSLTVEIPQPDGKGIRHSFKKFVQPYVDGGTYQNADTWYLQEVKMISYSNGVQSSEKSLTNSGAWETAIEIHGYPDFIGTIHGYEKLKRMYVYADGTKAPDGITKCDSVKIITVVSLLEQGSQNTEVCDVFRTYEFTLKGLKLSQKFVWKKAYASIKNAYVAMIPLLRADVSNKGIADFDYIEYDVSEAGATHPINSIKQGVKWARTYGNEIGVDMTVKYKNEAINNSYFLSRADAYNKMYFSYNYEQPVSIGTTWEVETIYGIAT